MDREPSNSNPPSSSLIVGIATHDQRAMIQSVMQLRRIGQLLQRPMQFFIGDGRTIPESRNRVVEAIVARYPREEAVWMLWLDSDILIPPNSASTIADAINWAESQQVCVVANYRMVTGQNVLIANREDPFHHYTDEELVGLPKPYPRVELAGLGFTYLHQPLAYRFYSDTTGEDLHFWWDHPDLPVHWIDTLRLVHRKAILLG